MPIVIDPKICKEGCTICDYFCPGDIIYRISPKEPPVVKYQDECWYCGICADNCPVNAITVVFPENMVNCRTDVRTLMGLPAQNESGD